MTVYIGDVHGKFARYSKLVKQCQNSIQVGDMGVGFISTTRGTSSNNPPYETMRNGGHRFIRGNHDNPEYCRWHSQWIVDGHYHDGTMFIGGATSIDREFRQEGYNWWKDEELSFDQLDKFHKTYQSVKPRVMVTHDCPESVAELMEAMSGRKKLNLSSQTRLKFQSMLADHKPELWVYGHWHYSFDEEFQGTRFVCLAELEAKEL